MPYLSLAVDGLNSTTERNNREFEIRPAEAANDQVIASTSMPVVALDPEQLEVYGWESSLWRKLGAYLGF